MQREYCGDRDASNAIEGRNVRDRTSGIVAIGSNIHHFTVAGGVALHYFGFACESARFPTAIQRIEGHRCTERRGLAREYSSTRSNAAAVALFWQTRMKQRRMKRFIAAVAVFSCAYALLTEARNAVPGNPRSVILSVAPQDRAAFATWSPIPGASYVLRWKAAAASNWVALDVGTSTSRAVLNLPNGVSHLFQLEARLSLSESVVSAPIESTPRARSGCAAIEYYPWLPPVSFFCTKQALDDYLARRGIDPLTLRCRQQPVTEWTVHIPDCIYTTAGGEQFLLLRSADVRFAGANQYPQSADIRRFARHAIWGVRDPFASALAASRTFLSQPIVGNVTHHAYAQSVELAYPGALPTRITWFMPPAPIPGRHAIYHEGHGGAAVEIGFDTIDWLLDRGWSVIAVDMPLLGLNRVDARPGLEAHGQFEALDDGVTSTLRFFLTPVRSVVDWIVEVEAGRNPDILMIGRSGGGLTSYIYGAIDPRIDIVVSVAGGRPISERLDAPWGAAELGDYEQTLPHVFNVVGHEHLMLAAGSKASMYIYNLWDGCCFRIQPDSAFVQYLRGGSAPMGKEISVFVDPDNPAHSIGPRGYIELDAFLGRALTVVGHPPSPPSGMRVTGK